MNTGETFRTEFRCNLKKQEEKNVFAKIENRDRLKYRTANHYLQCAVTAFEEESAAKGHREDKEFHGNLLEDIRKIVREEAGRSPVSAKEEDPFTERETASLNTSEAEEKAEDREELDPIVMSFLEEQM